jgi:hypothetical protein
MPVKSLLDMRLSPSAFYETDIEALAVFRLLLAFASIVADTFSPTDLLVC